MLLYAAFTPLPVIKPSIYKRSSITLRLQTKNSKTTCNLQQSQVGDAQYNSLKLLEWDKLCDLVSSFAGTSLGRQATKVQLWSINRNYEESLMLLKETNAAVEMHKHGACRLDFTGIDLHLVKSGIQNAGRGLPMSPHEAIAIATMLDYADVLQLNLEAAMKEDADWYKRFMPLSKTIMELATNQPLVRMIYQVVDEDGSVKDSASVALKRSHDQVRSLERKLYQLMDNLIKNDMKGASLLEVSNINGRWCIKSSTNQLVGFKGLLLSSNSGTESIIEPLSAVPLNDELQRARALVAKAEEDVLLMLTKKMQMNLDEIEKQLNSVIQLDMINARAKYSLSFGGVCPDLYLLEDMDELSADEVSDNRAVKSSYAHKREWKLYMPKAHHPLLLQQHRQNLRTARKDAKNANFQKVKGGMKRETDAGFSSEAQVSALEQEQPVPVDFFISQETRVLVITGPNTGGKTICLKTVGLAAMMARSGLHVLCSESVQLPWFDYILADIGDEQSLSQSLSTFSGHLKQISDIRSQSTNQSLILLDEVSAGTNPLEGASLGMALLESFADSGAFLTIATTHHGELKSLKYRNATFENACMEFDETNLKPTYKILWGIPGRSNAINVSEKLGLPNTIISVARELYGAASAEINEVIVEMERFKQESEKLLSGAQYHVRLSRELHEKLLLARRKIIEHDSHQRYRKMQEVSEIAATARSILHRKVQKHRAHIKKSSHSPILNLRSYKSDQITSKDSGRNLMSTESSHGIVTKTQSSARTALPQIGETVKVSFLGRKATVVSVNQSKDEIVVQAGNMKLKLKLMDIET